MIFVSSKKMTTIKYDFMRDFLQDFCSKSKVQFKAVNWKGFNHYFKKHKLHLERELKLCRCVVIISIINLGSTERGYSMERESIWRAGRLSFHGNVFYVPRGLKQRRQ